MTLTSSNLPGRMNGAMSGDIQGFAYEGGFEQHVGSRPGASLAGTNFSFSRMMTYSNGVVNKSQTTATSSFPARR